MVVFGGAGEGEGMGIIFNDTWSLNAEPVWAWTKLEPHGTPPAPRSSHICVRWAEANAGQMVPFTAARPAKQLVLQVSRCGSCLGCADAVAA